MTKIFTTNCYILWVGPEFHIISLSYVQCCEGYDGQFSDLASCSFPPLKVEIENKHWLEMTKLDQSEFVPAPYAGGNSHPDYDNRMETGLSGIESP